LVCGGFCLGFGMFDVIKWQGTLVENVSRCDGRLSNIKLGMRDLGIPIEIGLLTDTP
jgi:hypothetical protein|tara:strand:+ start:526 stop:696 length:171 start_codon:yes stop_codon:yes gene_type:complete